MLESEEMTVSSTPDENATQNTAVSGSDRVFRWVEQQPVFLAVVGAVTLHAILVLANRIFGVQEEWFSFTVAETAQVLLLFAAIYFSLLTFISLHRKSVLIVSRQNNVALQEAELKLAAIAEQNIRIQKESVEGFAKISEARDFSTGQHIQRMKEYAKAIAQAMSEHPKFAGIVTRQYVLDIHIAAPLHDIGKVGTKDDILKKRGKLSGEEFDLMKMHTIVGGDLMTELEEKLPGTTFFTRGREIAYHHHQRWDGTGYPNILSLGGTIAYFVESGVGRPLRGEEIPLSARIVALADVYDALRSRRVYKEPFTHETARDMIIQERGRHFDPDVVDAFLSIESEILQIAASLKD